MSKSLVIVESPTKAKTIAQFLDKSYIVESSVGHIRDLPESAKDIPADIKKEAWTRLGIDIEAGFKPLYLVSPAKKKQVDKLKKALKEADAVLLATDEDREGESISWHLQEVLKPKVPVKRLVFHEITREAIQHSLNTPRDIYTRLVSAQETRRILDRLYGYQISPLLWRKIGPSLSAGRVQSVAVRVIVNRERERMAFVPSAYWGLKGHFQPASGEGFQAELILLEGKRLATGRDFDEHTGQLKAGREAPVHLQENAAKELAQRLAGEQWRVLKVEQKPYVSKPPAPFTTSTLQQEANRKLRTGSRETMRLAQGLYEKGFITYMRTDSTTLSGQAVSAARKQIQQLYGNPYLPDGPRIYKSKVKNAQEAHEAIRPAGESFRKPEELRAELETAEWRLYEMIWKRTMASQMTDASGKRLLVQVSAEDAVFQATGKTIDFPGFLRAYVEGSDDPGATLGDQESLLPDLKPDQELSCQGMTPEDHVTQPPGRFTEASLIKELEGQGIGRPSTYASIIDTIIRREYVAKKNNALVPSFTAFAVVQLMEQHFTHLVDLDFTARMEDSLDAISRGETQSLPYLKGFYFGDGALPGLSELIEAEIDARQACTIPLGDRNGQIDVRIGRFGPYVQQGEQRVSVPMGMTPEELTLEKAVALLEKGNEPDVLGVDPATGQPVLLKNGRFGPYVQLGEGGEGEKPKMKSLLPNQEPEQVSLNDALQLLSLPRSLGQDPDSEEDIVADLGRYGPYLKRGSDSRSLTDPQQLFTIDLEQAREIFKREKSARRGAPTIIRALGVHPESGAAINLMNGRFGPYVSDGNLNASVPKASNPETLVLVDALGLLRARAEKAPAKKGRPKAKVAASKKTAPKSKTTAKTKSAAKATAAAKTRTATKAKKPTVRKKGSRAAQAKSA